MCDPDHIKAAGEMTRGFDGVENWFWSTTSRALRGSRGVQRLLETIPVPVGGEHVLRRPSCHVRAAGMDVERIERFKTGLVERLVARKPADGPNRDGSHEFGYSGG